MRTFYIRSDTHENIVGRLKCLRWMLWRYTYRLARRGDPFLKDDVLEHNYQWLKARRG